MRGLTLTQPWASAVALGIKHIETRSWRTDYRGPLLIHAAKGFPPYAREFAAEELAEGRIPPNVPLAAVVATARLDHIEHVEALDLGGDEVEWLYGDYSPGRYGWVLRDILPLATPVPCKGALGLWTPTPEVLHAVEWELSR